MRSETEERWKQLCGQAIVEQNPDKFMRIIHELNDALEANQLLPRFGNRAVRNGPTSPQAGLPRSRQSEPVDRISRE